MEIAGSTAIVFGGASGLGEATARRLRAEGAEVVIADVAVERAEALAVELGAHAAGADVTDEDSVATAVAAAAALGDGLRIAVCCAGVGDPSKLLGREGPSAAAHFEKVIGVNLLGTIRVLRHAADAIARTAPDAGGERGVLVATASAAAFDGQVGQVAYAASKGGVVAITLPIARELAARGIRMVSIAPGLFATPMLAGLPQAAKDSLSGTVPFPARLGDPAEFGDLVEHVVTNPMLNGETIRLDGALRMAPR